MFFHSVVHCVSCVAISLLGFVSDKCSFVVAFVDGLFIYGCNFLRFDTFRMSTRRLYVILFVFSFRVTVILIVAWCPMVAEEILFPSA